MQAQAEHANSSQKGPGWLVASNAGTSIPAFIWKKSVSTCFKHVLIIKMHIKCLYVKQKKKSTVPIN